MRNVTLISVNTYTSENHLTNPLVKNSKFNFFDFRHFNPLSSIISLTYCWEHYSSHWNTYPFIVGIFYQPGYLALCPMETFSQLSVLNYTVLGYNFHKNVKKIWGKSCLPPLQRLSSHLIALVETRFNILSFKIQYPRKSPALGLSGKFVDDLITHFQIYFSYRFLKTHRYCILISRYSVQPLYL